MEKEELDKIHEEYNQMLNYVNEDLYGSLTHKDKTELFLDLCIKEKLNKTTKNLFYATLALVTVAALQLYKEIKGVGSVSQLLNNIIEIAGVLFILYISLKAIEWFIKINKKYKKENIYSSKFHRK